MKKSVYKIVILGLMIIMFVSCAQIKNVSQALTNLKRLEFKLENVSGFGLMGVQLSNKSKISDFSLMDGVKLTKGFTSKSFPAEFVLNVAAKNPNDGTGGSRQSTATLSSLEWTLYIDDVPTIDGNIANAIEIPGTGQSSVIPIRISLDLYKFFADKGYDGVINLALALGGINSSPARLKLDAKPTVSTPFGPVAYPGRITIIDKQFTSQ